MLPTNLIYFNNLIDLFISNEMSKAGKWTFFSPNEHVRATRSAA